MWGGSIFSGFRRLLMNEVSAENLSNFLLVQTPKNSVRIEREPIEVSKAIEKSIHPAIKHKMNVKNITGMDPPVHQVRYTLSKTFTATRVITTVWFFTAISTYFILCGRTIEIRKMKLKIKSLIKCKSFTVKNLLSNKFEFFFSFCWQRKRDFH